MTYHTTLIGGRTLDLTEHHRGHTRALEITPLLLSFCPLNFEVQFAEYFHTPQEDLNIYHHQTSCEYRMALGDFSLSGMKCQ